MRIGSVSRGPAILLGILGLCLQEAVRKEDRGSPVVAVASFGKRVTSGTLPFVRRCPLIWEPRRAALKRLACSNWGGRVG